MARWHIQEENKSSERRAARILDEQVAKGSWQVHQTQEASNDEAGSFYGLAGACNGGGGAMRTSKKGKTQNT